LRIETYFQQLQALIESCSVVATVSITFDKRAPALGFVRGDLVMVDDSQLHVREYVDVEHEIERHTYAYQYMDAAKQLIFRYDNADHYRSLNLPTPPHHKHAGSEDSVVASPAPTLADVLREVEQLVQLP
jgi:Family of unknown function (DUF6516)